MPKNCYLHGLGKSLMAMDSRLTDQHIYRISNVLNFCTIKISADTQYSYCQRFNNYRDH